MRKYEGEIDKDTLDALACRKRRMFAEDHASLDTWKEVFYIVKIVPGELSIIQKCVVKELNFTGRAEWAYFTNYFHALACAYKVRKDNGRR